MAKRGNPTKASASPTTIRQEFRIEPEQVEYLDKIAESTSIGKAEIVRRALDLWIRQNPLDDFIKQNSK